MPQRRASFRVVVAVLLVAVLAGVVLVGRSYVARRSLSWQIGRGLELLERADTPAKMRAGLDRWERETRKDWEPHTDELIRRLYSDYPLDDPRVRLLLARVAGTEYGTRRDDWQRWLKSRQRLQRGLQPEVSKREAIQLEECWSAPIGLTAWFTTIVPLDGQIYVASLGSKLDDPQDRADGVVRVDGQTGEAALIFAPPADHRGPHDVVGIAACGDGLYAACRNGYVYRLGPDGEVRWFKHVGSPIVSPPLAVDANGDGDEDVIVVTRAGKAVALSGRRGTEIWVAAVSQPPAGADMLGATLALGDVLPVAGPELIVTTPNGDLEMLALRGGRALWRQELPAGTVAGAVCHRAADGTGPLAYLADRSGGVWEMVAANRTVEAVCANWVTLRADETVIASLRTFTAEPGKPPLVIGCPTGNYAGRRGMVCALTPGEGVHWRLAVDGAIWGTPALADLNGDGKPEIVLSSIEPFGSTSSGPQPRPARGPDATSESSGPPGVRGVVSFISLAGQCLHRLVVDAPVECSAVVADLDGDQRLEVLVADQSGMLHCYRTAGYGPVEWGLFGGDSHNTRNYANAYAYGQTAHGFQWRWKPE